MSIPPVTFQTIAPELPAGYTIPIAKLFSISSTEGLPIMLYEIVVGGPGAIELNGAADLFPDVPWSQNQVLINASELSAVTLAPTANSGIVHLSVVAYDGNQYYGSGDIAVTLTTNSSAVLAAPNILIPAGSQIAATSLFSVAGFLDPNASDTGYSFAVSSGNGVILGNGASNLATSAQASGTFQVNGSQLPLLTYQAPAAPGHYTVTIEVDPGTNQSWSDGQPVTITVTGPATSAAAEIENAAAGQSVNAAFVTDNAANVFANLDALQTNLQAGFLMGVTVTDSTTAQEVVTAARFAQDLGVIALISGNYSLTINGMTAAAAVALDTPSVLTHLAAINLQDSAADLMNNLFQLAGVMSTDHLASISLTDGTTPVLSLTAWEYNYDKPVVDLISSQFSLAISEIDAVSAAVIAAEPHVASITVVDRLANIATNLDSLQSLAADGQLISITLTDSAIPNISLSVPQLAQDSGALAAIVSDFSLTVNAFAANLSIIGLANRGTTALFSGAADQYGVTASDMPESIVVTDLSTGRASVDHLTNVIALQFTDGTDIIAQAPSSSQATTGNIAALYAAAFNRIPDVAGLAYYQAILQANPATPMITFAENFLQSPEYTANPAHAYTQNATGDAQFITDSYVNLLHRSPAAGDVAWYLGNVINPILAGLTPGSASYGAAELQAHATVLADFSASAEFLGDVQITATHPADAQHWLILV